MSLITQKLQDIIQDFSVSKINKTYYGEVRTDFN